MTELVAWMDSATKIGTPILIVVILLYLAVKILPEYIKHKQEAQASQQEYYNTRQKQYDAQMGIVIRIAEQGNQMVGQAIQVIERDMEVIRQNTEASKKNREAYEKVTAALDNEQRAVIDLTQYMKEHDKRAQDMQGDLIRIHTRQGGGE